MSKTEKKADGVCVCVCVWCWWAVRRDYTWDLSIVTCTLGILVEGSPSRICPKEIARNAHQDPKSFFITLSVSQKLEATMTSGIVRLEDWVSFKVLLMKIIMRLENSH